MIHEAHNGCDNRIVTTNDVVTATTLPREPKGLKAMSGPPEPTKRPQTPKKVE